MESGKREGSAGRKKGMIMKMKMHKQKSLTRRWAECTGRLDEGRLRGKLIKTFHSPFKSNL